MIFHFPFFVRAEHANDLRDDNGKVTSRWEGGEIVVAEAYDVPSQYERIFHWLLLIYAVPGYDTSTTNNLRLWSSKAASGEFDFQKFNSGEYEDSVADSQRAETISAVLYPNDKLVNRKSAIVYFPQLTFHSLERGKELRLKQQYFWCSASLFDIVRRFYKSKRPWKEFSSQVAIQLNDTHPTLAIPELLRILVDIEGVEWDEAWTSECFASAYLFVC